MPQYSGWIQHNGRPTRRTGQDVPSVSWFHLSESCRSGWHARREAGLHSPPRKAKGGEWSVWRIRWMESGFINRVLTESLPTGHLPFSRTFVPTCPLSVPCLEKASRIHRRSSVNKALRDPGLHATLLCQLKSAEEDGRGTNCSSGRTARPAL